MSVGHPLLAARGAGRRFGARTALEPTDLELWAGEIVALVGANGAGKSTLLGLLAGALPPSFGAVVRAEGVRVGWVPQRSAHYGRLSALENLELFARLEREPEPGDAARRLLERFELPAERRPTSGLSVGNRQRLDLAIALLGRPRVLLLDEPTASLDAARRHDLWETMAQVRDAGGAVCFATQNADEVERLADRVGVLRDGRLGAETPPA